MEARYRGIIRVLYIALAAHLALAVGKLLLGWQTGSLGILSDGVHSLLDGASSVIGILAITVASRPPDPGHPYGHRKFEILATLALSGLLLLTCWELLGTAIQRLMNPVELPHFSFGAVFFLLGAMGIHYTIARYEKDRGEAYDSPLLIADSIHARSDFLTTTFALIGISAGALGWFWLDAVAAIGIVIVIALASYGIVYECITTVTDANRLNPHDVRKVAESVSEVENAHAIRSHGMSNDIHLDLHIQIDHRLNAKEVFEIEDRVSRELKKAFPGVTEVAIRHEPSSLTPGQRDGNDLLL